MTWPAVVLWALMLLGFCRRGPMLLYVFSVAQTFGTLQMLPGEALGGVNILPQAVCAMLIVVRVFMQPGNIERALEAGLTSRRVGLFTLFTTLLFASALVLPRLFGGQIVVVPIVNASSGTTLLAPNSAHVTQPAYAMLSYLTAVSFSIVGDGAEFQRHYLRALLLQGLALVCTGLVDLVTFNVGASSLLEPFRNATYGLLTDTEAAGSKRIVGLMPEASAYGIACIVSAARLIFLRPCYEGRDRSWIVPAVILALLALTALSTSSSAYIGLGVLALCYGANWLLRVRSPLSLDPAGLRTEAVVIGASALGVAALMLVNPGAFTPLWDVIDVMVFQKTSSMSYVERSMWTQVGWTAFIDSGGLGIGFGSARVSNWYVAILSATGVLGALLLFGFVLKLLCAPTPSGSAYARELLRGLRISLIPWLVVGWFSGAVPDMGADIAATLGMLAGLGSREVDGRRAVVSAADPERRAARRVDRAPLRTRQSFAPRAAMQANKADRTSPTA